MRKVAVKDNIRVVTANDFISARGDLPNFTAKERKLLYIAISQCRKDDKGFYYYAISVKDFAEMMDLDPSNVYQESKAITSALGSTQIAIEKTGGKGYRNYSLFSFCDYDNIKGLITFKLNPDMTDLLLGLRRNFTQPLLGDFMEMRSPYSMAIWHLMQREMHSKKPYADNKIVFDLSLQELRAVTGTENKLKQVSDFKAGVLDRAITEIDENCGVKITYDNIKTGRTVTGFRFTATSNLYNPDTMTPEQQEHLTKAKKRSNELWSGSGSRA